MLLHGDCLEKLKELENNSIESVVTDPPYGLQFMGKKWDYDVPSVEIWQEVYRVMKPGAFLLSFAGTRTHHRMAVNIEDAGFEIRDMIAWVYGSGFPKSHNIGKAVDKLQGNEREDLGESENNRDRSKHTYNSVGNVGSNARVTKGNSPWEGWGTALKPALEPIVVAQKPREGTFAENVLKWGTGGINIDGSRIGNESGLQRPARKGKGNVGGWANYKQKDGLQGSQDGQGRFPANFIHDGSEEVERLFPNTKSGGGDRNSKGKTELFKGYGDTGVDRPFPANEGSASRFFYCAKASKSERNKGLEGFEEKESTKQFMVGMDNVEHSDGYKRANKPIKAQNNHPTVKPLKLMQYLVKLVTPPDGTVLDPFMGSGTTGIACKKENFNFIGIEREEEYIKIAEARMKSY